MGDVDAVARQPLSQSESARAHRAWWDEQADDYQDEHGAFLGDADLVWGPEGLREADANLLGDIRGLSVVEIGAGAAQCSRYLAARGARVLATDISHGMLRHSRVLDERTGIHVPVAQADACALPVADASVDLVFSSYGAVPFVADFGALAREVRRVLRVGGRFVFSTTHPIRWAFRDDPGPAGLTAVESYFDRTPYVELDAAGQASYVEHHATLGDRIRDLVAAGFEIVDLVEPEWPSGHDQAWGQWSPLRGALLPGTAIYLCRAR
jgi:SAM-dependent methyltransferase